MATPIATLSMYDWPETRPYLERFWELILTELGKTGIPSPLFLQKADEQMPLWTSPDLVIGQTCGWPFANHLMEITVPFARFDFGLEGCPPGTYQSLYIGQDKNDAQYLENFDALASCPSVAINGEDSQSGFHVFSEISNKPGADTLNPGQRVLTGAHRNSIRAVAEGNARIAAIDAVAFALAKKYDPQIVDAVQIIGRSEPKPGLPLITSRRLENRKDALLNAIVTAHAGLSRDESNGLMIQNIIPAKASDYTVFLAHDCNLSFHTNQ